MVLDPVVVVVVVEGGVVAMGQVPAMVLVVAQAMVLVLVVG
jgi:hypothetical protein